MTPSQMFRSKITHVRPSPSRASGICRRISLLPPHSIVTLLTAALGLHLTTELSARTLHVDARGGAEFESVRTAVAHAQPGDIVKLAPGSGPYREAVTIQHSGTADSPIVLDGSGEEITGFDPVTVTITEDGRRLIDLSPYHTAPRRRPGFSMVDEHWTHKTVPLALPFVLRYQGQRLRQLHPTGQLDRFARLSADRNTLELLPESETSGWEISVRGSTIGILNASHWRIINVIASGALNDGFNLHGEGQDLVFENVVGRDNIDEGFSAHDNISCTIRQGRFHGNDNGIVNVNASHLEGASITCHDNLGHGFLLVSATAVITDLDSHQNGVCQFSLSRGAQAQLERVTVVEVAPGQKPWITCQNTATSTTRRAIDISPDSHCTGQPLRLLAP